MKRQALLNAALIPIIATSAACPYSVNGWSPRSPLSVPQSANPPQDPKVAPKPVAGKESEAYKQTVLKRLRKRDFKWIDNEASKARTYKERLPGGYWKLRSLYSVMEKPMTGEQPSEGDWEDLIRDLSAWSQQHPESVTAKVALATVWQQYAWKARGMGSANTVSDVARETFQKRLANAAEILTAATSLKEKCPHWFVTAIWVGLGQGWERGALDRVFDDAIKLEPTYYYLYQAKATYLLPRWIGVEGEWERFAEDSALHLGGHQGDIVRFTVYSQMMSLHDVTFMNTHQHVVPKLIDGFRSLEKLYGASPHRLNEACYFAVFGNDLATASELFKRVGEDYDPSVWRSNQHFEVYRSGIQLRIRLSKNQTENPAQTSPQKTPPQN